MAPRKREDTTCFCHPSFASRLVCEQWRKSAFQACARGNQSRSMWANVCLDLALRAQQVMRQNARQHAHRAQHSVHRIAPLLFQVCILKRHRKGYTQSFEAIRSGYAGPNSRVCHQRCQHELRQAAPGFRAGRHRSLAGSNAGHYHSREPWCLHALHRHCSG